MLMSGWKERVAQGGWVSNEDDDYGDYLRDVNLCAERLYRFNSIPGNRYEELTAALSELVGYETDPSVCVKSPFRCDLGYNIKFGRNIIVNYGCVFLDTAEISIGDDCLIGPGCLIVTAHHPMDSADRKNFSTGGKPIRIGNGCWFGAGAIVLPGITIGNNCIVGAGAVVTHDVPDNTVVVGNPARPIVRKNA